MSDRSAIEWTDATWNPVTGCTEVSPGCDHCYAKTFAERFRGVPGHHFENGFDVQLRPDKLDQPLRWKRPRRVFVNSMSDLFHEAVPDVYIAQVFAVMHDADQHTYQVLTKRHGRMRSLLRSQDFYEQLVGQVARLRAAEQRYANPNVTWPLPNVWLGVSAEDQKWTDIRIPALLETPAAVRFLSAEPLLGPITLTRLHQRCPEHDFAGGFCSSWHPGIVGLDWVIVGGESGRGARPMNLDWVRVLRDQCANAGVAFFYKQQGSADGGPKSRRVLDGRTWDEFPAEVAS